MLAALSVRTRVNPPKTMNTVTTTIILMIIITTTVMIATTTSTTPTSATTANSRRDKIDLKRCYTGGGEWRSPDYQTLIMNVWLEPDVDDKIRAAASACSTPAQRAIAPSATVSTKIGRWFDEGFLLSFSR